MPESSADVQSRAVKSDFIVESLKMETNKADIEVSDNLDLKAELLSDHYKANNTSSDTIPEDEADEEICNLPPIDVITAGAHRNTANDRIIVALEDTVQDFDLHTSFEISVDLKRKRAATSTGSPKRRLSARGKCLPTGRAYTDGILGCLSHSQFSQYGVPDLSQHSQPVTPTSSLGKRKSTEEAKYEAIFCTSSSSDSGSIVNSPPSLIHQESPSPVREFAQLRKIGEKYNNILNTKTPKFSPDPSLTRPSTTGTGLVRNKNFDINKRPASAGTFVIPSPSLFPLYETPAEKHLNSSVLPEGLANQNKTGFNESEYLGEKRHGYCLFPENISQTPLQSNISNITPDSSPVSLVKRPHSAGPGLFRTSKPTLNRRPATTGTFIIEEEKGIEKINLSNPFPSGRLQTGIHFENHSTAQKKSPFDLNDIQRPSHKRSRSSAVVDEHSYNHILDGLLASPFPSYHPMSIDEQVEFEAQLDLESTTDATDEEVDEEEINDNRMNYTSFLEVNEHNDEACISYQTEIAKISSDSPSQSGTPCTEIISSETRNSTPIDETFVTNEMSSPLSRSTSINNSQAAIGNIVEENEIFYERHLYEEPSSQSDGDIGNDRICYSNIESLDENCATQALEIDSTLQNSNPEEASAIAIDDSVLEKDMAANNASGTFTKSLSYEEVLGSLTMPIESHTDESFKSTESLPRKPIRSGTIARACKATKHMSLPVFSGIRGVQMGYFIEDTASKVLHDVDLPKKTRRARAPTIIEEDEPETPMENGRTQRPSFRVGLSRLAKVRPIHGYLQKNKKK